MKIRHVIRESKTIVHVRHVEEAFELVRKYGGWAAIKHVESPPVRWFGPAWTYGEVQDYLGGLWIIKKAPYETSYEA